MRTSTPSPALVRAGLAPEPKTKPTSPAGKRRGRWSPPLPQS